MNLQEILHTLQGAEKELAKLVKQEQKRTGKPITYTFVYEQTYIDSPRWGSHYHIVEAYDIEQAFSEFGHTVRVLGLTVRNVCCGTYEEMEEYIECIKDYYRKLPKIKDEEPTSMTQEITAITVVPDTKAIFEYQYGDLGQPLQSQGLQGWMIRCPGCGSFNILTGKITVHDDGTVSSTQPLHCHGSKARKQYTIERNKVRWL
jgi:hypothetical protein